MRLNQPAVFGSQHCTGGPKCQPNQRVDSSKMPAWGQQYRIGKKPYVGARRPGSPLAAQSQVMMGRCILGYARPGSLILTGSSS
jgi:hypothetical protein